MTSKSPSFAILASEVCSEYLCDFAADGFVLDPEGNGVSAEVYCERCGRQMVSEYNQKVSPGWKFQPGQILGDPTERRPSAPRYPEAKRIPPNQEPEKPCSFLSYVVDRLTSHAGLLWASFPRRSGWKARSLLKAVKMAQGIVSHRRNPLFVVCLDVTREGTAGSWV